MMPENMGEIREMDVNPMEITVKSLNAMSALALSVGVDDGFSQSVAMMRVITWDDKEHVFMLGADAVEGLAEVVEEMRILVKFIKEMEEES